MKTLVIFGVTLALVGCATPRPAPMPTPTPKEQAAPFVPTAFIVEPDKARIEDLLNNVRNKLKDPESARFYGVYMTKRNAKQESPNVCGYVNSKNSYGGYVGKTRFLSGDGYVALWENGADASPSGSAYNLGIRNNCTLKDGVKAPSNSVEWK